jgi:predicted RNA-binding protein with PUA-like domain
MSYNLFLDDERMPKDAFSYTHLPEFISESWVIVRNYYAFVALIEGKGW